MRKASAIKTCSICGKGKPVDQFNSVKAYKDGIRSECRECIRTRVREWKERNPEKLQAQRERAQKRIAATRDR